MKQSELNHLRRLLAWVRCEYYMEPEEWVEIVREHGAMSLGPADDEAKRRLVEYHDKLRSCPKYVRAAVKALHPLVSNLGEVVEGDESPALLALSSPPLMKEADPADFGVTK